MSNDHLENNMKLWDEMAGIHKHSYTEIHSVLAGKSIIRNPEKQELGNISGKTLLHIQCHIGTDSISLAYEGAIVTGTDFSSKSIAIARELAERTDTDVDFIICPNNELVHCISNTYDIVYMSRGVLCWNNDINALMKSIYRLLKPGGFFYLQESHPMLGTLNESDPHIHIEFPYFHTNEPVKWEDNYDYSAADTRLSHPSFEWIWPISDIVNSISEAGMCIEFLNEFDYLFYKAVDYMEKNSDGYWYIPGLEKKFPLMFSLKAGKGTGVESVESSQNKQL